MFIRKLKTNTTIDSSNRIGNKNAKLFGVKITDDKYNSHNYLDFQVRTKVEKLPDNEFENKTEEFEKQLRELEQSQLEEDFNNLRDEFAKKRKEIHQRLLEVEKEASELLELKASVLHYKRTIDYKEAEAENKKRIESLYENNLINKWRGNDELGFRGEKEEIIENENLKLKIDMRLLSGEYYIEFLMKIPACAEEFLWEGEEKFVFYYTTKITGIKKAYDYYEKKKEQYENMFFKENKFDIEKEIEIIDNETLEKEKTTIKDLVCLEKKSPSFND
jgi:hypothetical protein